MRRLTHRSLTLLSVFHLSIASRKDFSDFSTALFFPRASAVPEMTMHRGCAAAIVHGVLQQATTIKAMLGRTYPPLISPGPSPFYALLRR